MAPSFSAIRISFSTFVRPEISRAIPDAPAISPEGSPIRETVKETGISLPSLQRAASFHNDRSAPLRESEPEPHHVVLSAGASESRNWLPNHLLCGISKNTFGSAVPNGDHAFYRVANDCIVAGLNDGSKPLRQAKVQHHAQESVKDLRMGRNDCETSPDAEGVRKVLPCGHHHDENDYQHEHTGDCSLESSGDREGLHLRLTQSRSPRVRTTG
jgi:hypothetical protein